MIANSAIFAGSPLATLQNLCFALRPYQFDKSAIDRERRPRAAALHIYRFDIYHRAIWKMSRNRAVDRLELRRERGAHRLHFLPVSLA
jgi:hypothetical protein